MCETGEMPERTTNLTAVAGTFDLDAEVARLLEMPDARQAMPLIKQLARRVRPAANSSLAIVEAGSQVIFRVEPGLQGNHE